MWTCAGSLCLATAAFAAEEPTLFDGVAAKVNEHVITVSDVIQQVAPRLQDLSRNHSGQELTNMLKKAYAKGVDDMIEERLIIDAYARQDGRIPEWVIDERVNSVIHDRFNDDRSQLLAALARDRMTFENFRDQIRRGIVVMAMRAEHVDKYVKVPAGAEFAYYEAHKNEFILPGKVRLRMAVFEIDRTRNNAEVQWKSARDVLEKLKDNADFAKVVESASATPKNKPGGDWGWVEPSMFREDLQEAIAGLKIGEISDIIQAGDTLYILKVEERQNETQAPFEKVRQSIERTLRREQVEKVHREWIERLKRAAHIHRTNVNPF